MTERKERQALYKSRQWHRLRWHQLSDEPLCALCLQLGKYVAASIADHVKPHKGNEDLFFDPDNLQSLCKPCHDAHKQRQDRTGVLAGCDVHGVPLDPGSHWK